MCAVASVGLISDTHGLLRPEALVALQGSDLIIHAGDVGKPQIIKQLRALAPVVAVRGNINKGVCASQPPMTAVAEAGSTLILTRGWYFELIVRALPRNGVED